MIRMFLPLFAVAGICSISGGRKSYRVPHHASFFKKARRVQCALCGNIFKIGKDSRVYNYKCKCGCIALTENSIDVKTKSHSR